MTEQQARYVKKMKIDQGCMDSTIARKFFNEFGPSNQCSKDHAEAVLYSDTKGQTQRHVFSNGKMPKGSVIEYLFPDSVGNTLCESARKLLKEGVDEGWFDTASQH